MHRSNGGGGCGLALTVSVLLLVTTTGASGAVFQVESTADAPDANPGDGICADATGACTLRAALREANANESADEISLPAGGFVVPPPILPQPLGEVGENPVLEDLTLAGVGAGATTLEGSLDLGVCFFGCGGPTVSIRQLTLHAPSDGTGIASFGSLKLDRVTTSATISSATRSTK